MAVRLPLLKLLHRPKPPRLQKKLLRLKLRPQRQLLLLKPRLPPKLRQPLRLRLLKQRPRRKLLPLKFL